MFTTKRSMRWDFAVNASLGLREISAVRILTSAGTFLVFCNASNCILVENHKTCFWRHQFCVRSALL